MDVSTAVQLDRIEELERAIAELDPDQFLRKDGLDAPLSAIAPPSTRTAVTARRLGMFTMRRRGTDASATGALPTAPALAAAGIDMRTMMVDDHRPDLPGGIDIGAIIAAAESAHDHDHDHEHEK
jgi:hypothetical protein